MQQHENSLFTSFVLNKSLTLKNRIVMAPMTRSQSDDHFLATTEMAAYYARRAQVGLIITEGTVIDAKGTGYPRVPGIYNEAQVNAWHKVTDAVHQQEGYIFAQIWHVGRVTHPDLIAGAIPISASATSMTGTLPRSRHLQYGQAHAASLVEINCLQEQFVMAAKNAIAAGFDGVELHGANGYLIDQFLHYATNHRVDAYGGSTENNARFAIEVVQAAGQAIGFDKVGIRLSPAAYLNQIQPDLRDADVFRYLLQQLDEMAIAYVHTGNFDDRVSYPVLDNQTMTAFLRRYYQGTLIASGSYDYESANCGLRDKQFDLVALGRPLIANPDLVQKFKAQQQLTSYHEAMLETLY
jgi:N-ethylmaleimide reductase